MKVTISSQPSVKFRHTLDFRYGNEYQRPVTTKETDVSDSLILVDSALETIKNLCGELPKNSLEAADMLKQACDEVFRLRDDRPFSDNGKLPAYLDICAAANYLFNMMASGETGFKFVYEQLN